MPTKKSSKQSTSESTTIAIEKTVQHQLNHLRKGVETYNDIIKRLLISEGDVYFEPILIDYELPFTHDIVFQLGAVLYHLEFGAQEAKEITKAEVQKLLKQPRLTMTITQGEAKLVQMGFDQLNWQAQGNKAFLDFRQKLDNFLSEAK